MRKTNLTIAAAVLFCLTMAASAEGDSKVGAKAPNFWLRPLNKDMIMQLNQGKQKIKRATIGLDQFVGARAENPAKVLVLSFFANYCKPCKKELPELQKLYAENHGKGLRILAINTDSDPKEREEAVKFVNASNITFPVLKDSLEVVRRRYGVKQYPSIFVVDSQGVIRNHHEAFNEETFNQLKQEIQSYLK